MMVPGVLGGSYGAKGVHAGNGGTEAGAALVIVCACWLLQKFWGLPGLEILPTFPTTRTSRIQRMC